MVVLVEVHGPLCLEIRISPAFTMMPTWSGLRGLGALPRQPRRVDQPEAVHEVLVLHGDLGGPHGSVVTTMEKHRRHVAGGVRCAPLLDSRGFGLRNPGQKCLGDEDRLHVEAFLQRSLRFLFQNIKVPRVALAQKTQCKP